MLFKHFQGFVKEERSCDKVATIDIQQETRGFGDKEDGGAIQSVDRGGVGKEQRQESVELARFFKEEIYGRIKEK